MRHDDSADLAYLRRLGDAIRSAPTRRDKQLAIIVTLGKIQECRLAGHSPAVLATAIGYSRSTVRRWLLTYETKRVPAPPAEPPSRLPAVAPPTERDQPQPSWMSTSISQSLDQSQPAVIDGAWSGSGTRGPGRLVLPPGIHGCDVLLISGHPRPGDNMLAPEAAAIRQCFYLARLTSEEKACVQVGELTRLLDDFRPVVLHVTAHAEFGGIHLTESYEPLPVDYRTFAGMIREAPLAPRLVVLSVCDSTPVAAMLAGRIDSAIAWPSDLDDEQALAFSQNLYTSLVTGHSVGNACADGRATITAQWPDADPPELAGTGAPVLFP